MGRKSFLVMVPIIVAFCHGGSKGFILVHSTGQRQHNFSGSSAVWSGTFEAD